MRGGPYNLTDEIGLFVHLLTQRIEELSHIDSGRVLHGITQARARTSHGLFAQCFGLRFRAGHKEVVRGRWRWVWPDVRVRGKVVLYYITYCLPRFLDQSPLERVKTLVHELYHISPQFNGDLRRFPGRNCFHGNSKVDFDDVVDRISERVAGRIRLERFLFLRYGFEELQKKYGGVVGARLKGFQPKRLPVEKGAKPLPQAEMPRKKSSPRTPAALPSGTPRRRQRTLFDDR